MLAKVLVAININLKVWFGMLAQTSLRRCLLKVLVCLKSDTLIPPFPCAISSSSGKGARSCSVSWIWSLWSGNYLG